MPAPVPVSGVTASACHCSASCQPEALTLSVSAILSTMLCRRGWLNFAPEKLLIDLKKYTPSSLGFSIPSGMKKSGYFQLISAFHNRTMQGCWDCVQYGSHCHYCAIWADKSDLAIHTIVIFCSSQEQAAYYQCPLFRVSEKEMWDGLCDLIHNQAGVTRTPLTSRSTQNNFKNIPIVKLLKWHRTRNQEVKRVVFFFKGLICVLIFQIKLKKE